MLSSDVASLGDMDRDAASSAKPPTRPDGRAFWPLLPLAIVAGTFVLNFSPAAALNWLAPKGGIEVARSIGYGEGPRATLDIYRPDDAGSAPVIVFFYGGRWDSGSKDTYVFLASALARRGYITLVPDYRLYPQVVFPDFLMDGAEAVKWARDNAAGFGGDRDKIFLMGHSAGAHIAAMLALDGQWLNAAGIEPGRDIAGLVGLSGPYDFLPLEDPTLKIIFGGDNRPETQPINFVTPDAPPALLATSETDETVKPGNTTRLAAVLREKDNMVETIVYPRGGHLGVVGAFSPLLSFVVPVLDDVDAFIGRIAGEAQQRGRAAQ